jgi:ferritin-like metal-binding protein YciE
MAAAIEDHLTAYLTDAHAIEEQALAQLRSLPELADAPQLAAVLHDHLAETEGHERSVKALLEHRDAKPSWFKDVVMRIGGKGFILFARLNPDTPGKLLAHAYSYEALEQASYALLALVADRAGEAEVAASARRIEAEEHAMKERLAACFDEGARASLGTLAPDELRGHVGAYLADAHALEQQSLGLLKRAAEASTGRLAAAFETHRAETELQSSKVEARLAAIGHDTSALKDAAMRVAAVNWATFFQAHPDTPGKLAAFGYAFEHLEIGGYAQLARVARIAGDGETAALAGELLAQEQHAADGLEELFPEAAEAALER